MDKPTITIGCIGHQDHGKTSLFIAMVARAKAKGMRAEWPPYWYMMCGPTHDGVLAAKKALGETK